MTVASKQEPFILLLGDILFFLFALWLTLTLRYFELPDSRLLYSHLVPFSVLFVVWVLVYFISGLYGKHTTLLRSRILSIIVNAQIINVVFAALFFFFIPYFGITPKTNLVIYLVLSSLLVALWRVYLFPLVGFHRRQKAVLIGYRDEAEALVAEVNKNPRYNLEFVLVGHLDEEFDSEGFRKEISDLVRAEEVSVIVADIKSRKMESVLPVFYSLAFLEWKVTFLDIHKVYESIFDRVPFSAVNDQWFLENISSTSTRFYDVLKRLMDIVIALPASIVPIAIFPFIAILSHMSGRERTLSVQTRIGRGNRPIRVFKFGTMIYDDNGMWNTGQENHVTTIGSILRRTRIDELPQLWNVLRGDLSLVGPRPEFPQAVEAYTEKIPYYPMRHLITPGLSGWAQLYGEHPHHNIGIEETRNKLSYDLYYIKERSFFLDVYIGLQTIKTLLSRSGR